jgi:histidinol dehydrogenase
VRVLTFTDKSFHDDLAAFCRGAIVSKEISDSVRTILEDVRSRGDEAVSYFAAKFDGAKLAPRAFRVKESEIVSARKRLQSVDQKAIESSLEAVVAFNQRGLPKDWTAKNPHGAEVGEMYHPIRRVGLYVPGGQVPLVSTVLMTAPLAKIAGCPEVVAYTPSNAEGRIADGLLAALDLSGVKEIYRIGGVQAVGAMAYGTVTLRAVDKIFGPGNAYVCEAKRQVFGTVGVDSLPGPSEVMVIVDDSADLSFAAADLLAQAEHGSGREKIYLVATSQALVEEIKTQLHLQVKALPRSGKIAPVLAQGLLAMVVPSLEQAVEIANYVAPEHLQLLVNEAEQSVLCRRITTAGAIMLGNLTPTALGDFAAGPSHVLPTGRAGRFFSGLRVSDFMRRTSVMRYDRASIKKASPVVAAFASMEQLAAHGRSVALRVRG